ncbi:MAG: caspase family protein [Bradyrhizobium sp.]
MGLFRQLGLFFFVVVVFGCFTRGPAFAEKRVALVIGNSGYQHVARLPNPANDAGLVARTLKAAGFDTVDLRRDLTNAEMRRALRDFTDEAQDADIAIVYYAGHGLEVGGTNYAIPVDAVLERDTDVLDEAVSLDRILAAIAPAKRLQLIILDACRNNPFADRMKRTIAFRSVGRGLAKAEPTSPNTLIAFAAKAGSTAEDGNGKDSPFTTALAKEIARPGLDVRRAFGYVRDDVLKATGRRQEPYVYGSLGGNDLPLVPAPQVTARPPVVDSGAAIRHDYEMAAQVGTREAWDGFIATYPDGFYARLAMAQLKKLDAEAARAAAAEKARLAEAQANQAAEDSRLAAERQKAIEAARLAEAKRAKATAEAKAAEDIAKLAEIKAKAEALQLAKAAEAAEDKARLAEAKLKAETVQQAKAAEAAQAANEAARAKGTISNDTQGSTPVGQLAALTPPGQAEQVGPAAGDLVRRLLMELRRVGCNRGAVDSDWNAAARESLSSFNRYAGTTLDLKVASFDTLDVVKSRTGRICPLVCQRGYKADGDICVKIACKPGYRLGRDNSCAKISGKRPVASREAPAAHERPRRTAPRLQAQSSGQILCNQAGCRPVRRGCFLARGHFAGRHGRGNNEREICP